MIYGTEIANKALLRIFYIEKTLKYFDFETIDTNEFFFLLYYVFRYLMDYFRIKGQNEMYKSMHVVNVMELSSYIVYSYFGPTVDYCFRVFASNLNISWKIIILDIVCKTDLPYKLIKLNLDKGYFDMELKQFLLLNN